MLISSGPDYSLQCEGNLKVNTSEFVNVSIRIIIILTLD